MAPGNKRAEAPASGGKGRREVKRPAAQPADASSTNEPTAEEESDAPPLNRAERRLAAKRKAGRNATRRVTPNGMSSSTDSMRRRGVQGPGGSMKGTNTRKSG